MQDRKGFIWIGTEDGANRYDGYRFQILRPQQGKTDSISNNFIYSICEDQEGNLWFGTDNGLNRYSQNLENFKRFMADKKNPQALANNRCFVVKPDRQGSIWVGTEGGLHRVDSKTQKIVRYLAAGGSPHALSHNNIRAICQDRSGMIWIGTYGGGLNRLDPQTGRFMVYRQEHDNPNSLSNDYVLAIIEDRAGNLWIGTQNGGLNRLDAGRKKFVRYQFDRKNPSGLSDNWINCLYEDGEGKIWIGTNNGGANQLDPQTGRFTVYRNDPKNAYSLSGNRINYISQDHSGTIWIGAIGNGLNLFNRNTSDFVHIFRIPDSTNSVSHNSFLEDPDGTLWLGTDTVGLKRIDPTTGKSTLFQFDSGNPLSISSNRVFSIVRDKSGTLWIGTYGGGLNRFNPQSSTFTRFQSQPNINSLSDNRIRKLCPSRSGGIWIGTDGGGLNYYDPDKILFTRYLNDPANPDSLSINRIFCLLEDSDTGKLWVGTFGDGLNLFDSRSGKFTRIPPNPELLNGLPNGYILALNKSAAGILWIGSNGGGLTRFDTKIDTFESFNDAQGLPNNTVYGILEDEEGALWLSTNKGIARFDPQRHSFRNFEESNGLQGNEFNGGAYYKGPTGMFYFGGVKGYNIFNPQNILSNPNPPEVVITGMQLSNKPVQIGTTLSGGKPVLAKSIIQTDAIQLSYRDRVISFEFAALNYISPEKNQFAYMMEGFENEWSYVGNRRFATYTNLPARTYTFRVKASNNDGLWNERGISLKITISPPFWKTWWFITFSALIFVSVILLRINSLTRAKTKLENIVALRTRELEEISLKDPLTGLRNRRYINEVLQDDIQAFIRKKIYFYKNRISRRHDSDRNVYGILMIDIDLFKTINDQFGHDMGDRWLMQFSAILKRHVRADDAVIRFGGEEFLIVLKNTLPDYIDICARKIKSEVTHIELALENRDLQRSCSIGCTRFPFYDSDPALISFERTIILADLALYYAKRNGRNMVVNIIPKETIPNQEQAQQITTSLEFGISNNFYKIIPFV